MHLQIPAGAYDGYTFAVPRVGSIRLEDNDVGNLIVQVDQHLAHSFGCRLFNRFPFAQFKCSSVFGLVTQVIEEPHEVFFREEDDVKDVHMYLAVSSLTHE